MPEAMPGRLTDALLQRLGPESVFQDVTAISPGQDYTVAIDRALADSDAALVVIGPGWLTAVTPQGTRRLLDADDYVHLELARALGRDIRVIPVLVGGARMPEAAELPDDLQGLAQRQALEMHNEAWHHDIDGLVRSLRGEPAVPANRRRRWLVAGTVLIALLGLGAGAWFLWGQALARRLDRRLPSHLARSQPAKSGTGFRSTKTPQPWIGSTRVIR
jgi:hypothetical protein